MIEVIVSAMRSIPAGVVVSKVVVSSEFSIPVTKERRSKSAIFALLCVGRGGGDDKLRMVWTA